MNFRSIFLILFIFLSSCSSMSLSFSESVSYFLQAGKGQLELWNRSESIKTWLEDPKFKERISPRVAAFLKELPEIKKFGIKSGLKETSNYEKYIQLNRDAVVYSVSACAPLSFNVKKWNFPILGSVPYLGFFSKEDALNYAKKIRDESSDDDLKKLDIDVRPVSAYSTLGWLSDPLLSSMIREGSDALGELVEVVLHESTHATLYISDQTPFNESLASFVGETLTVRYLKETRGETSPEFKSYFEGVLFGKKISDAFSKAATELKKNYDSSSADTEKLAEKKKILNQIKETYHLKRDLNNASLSQYLTYSEGTKPFQIYYKEKCGEDLNRFLKSLFQLSEKSFTQKQTEDFSSVLNLLDCKS